MEYNMLSKEEIKERNRQARKQNFGENRNAFGCISTIILFFIFPPAAIAGLILWYFLNEDTKKM